VTRTVYSVNIADFLVDYVQLEIALTINLILTSRLKHNQKS